MSTFSDPRAKPVPPAWRHEIVSWCEYLLAADQSPTTVRSRRDHLQRASRALKVAPWDVQPDDLIAWAAVQEWARETRRSVYASLRGFYRWGVATGRTQTDPTQRLPRTKQADPLPRPAPLKAVEIGILHADSRTRLILRLAIELGLRRAEIAQIHAKDLWEDLEGWSLTVHGKGKKDRDIPLPADLAFILRATSMGDWLFPSEKSSTGHLTPEYVGVLAGRVLPHPWTLHTLRHAFATGIYVETQDLLVVQQLLGHSSVATTQRYVQVPHQALRAAIVQRSRQRPAS